MGKYNKENKKYCLKINKKLFSVHKIDSYAYMEKEGFFFN